VASGGVGHGAASVGFFGKLGIPTAYRSRCRIRQVLHKAWFHVGVPMRAADRSPKVGARSVSSRRRPGRVRRQERSTGSCASTGRPGVVTATARCASSLAIDCAPADISTGRLGPMTLIPAAVPWVA